MISKKEILFQRKLILSNISNIEHIYISTKYMEASEEGWVNSENH